MSVWVDIYTKILYTYDTSINQRFLSMLLILGLLLYAHPYLYTFSLYDIMYDEGCRRRLSDVCKFAMVMGGIKGMEE